MTPSGPNDRLALLTKAIAQKKAARSLHGAIPPRPPGQAAFLGEMQRSLWVLHRMDPQSAAYNLASGYAVQGTLDLARLEHSLGIVVSRHRLLRSTFRSSGDTAEQIVHETMLVAVRVVAADDGQLLEVATGEAARPFDLTAGPVFRMSLVEERSTSARLLLLVVHHIVADERSLDALWTEVADLYNGAPLAAGPDIQFDDFVCWSDAQPDTTREQALAFWRDRLTPVPSVLVLPFETPAATASASGALARAPLDPAVQQGVRRLAARIESTPFTIFAFAFRLLLERYVAGRTIAFATPASTRTHAATGSMLGYFLNPVVMATTVDERLPVETSLRDFARDLREALLHASVPFEVLARDLSPPRQSDRHPIFQVMFVLREGAGSPMLGDVRLSPVTLDLGVAKFDLTLFVTSRAGSADVAVEYRTDRFEGIWIERLMGHYATLLEHLVTDTGRPVSTVPMLTAAEHQQLRETWQGAAIDPSSVPLLPQQILDAARLSPDVQAVVGPGFSQTYAELERAASAIARQLVAQGVSPGDRVGVLLDRSVHLIAGLLGSHLAGAAYVPLDPSYPADRIRYALEDADVAAVVTTNDLRRRLLSSASPAVCLDDEGSAQGTPAVGLPTVEPEQPAYILYTSGSTGRPKGVEVTHANLRASTLARFEGYDKAPGRFLLVPSIAFDSSVAGIFWTLASGGTLVLPSDDDVRDPRRLARLVASQRVTTLLCVPSLYAEILHAGDDLLSLTMVIVAGERCPASLVCDHFGIASHARLFNEYGPTEGTVWATVQELTADDITDPVPIGRPIAGVRVDVLDALGRRVPAGVPGLGFIAGPTVARGYWRRPELTRESFVADPEAMVPGGRMYRSGDCMAWTAGGRLLFLGREDDQIKIRGFRIEPGEVEAALIGHPGVTEAAVVARSASGLKAGPPGHAGGNETLHLVAFLMMSPPGLPLPSRETLRARLPDYMLPGRYVVLETLPRLPNGKVDRASLGVVPLTETDAAATAVPPASAREEMLLTLWEGLLQRRGFGVTDNFFELGGHSLLIVTMADSIERDHGVTLSAADVFQHPTVRDLAERIGQQLPPNTTPYRHLFPIQPSGRRTPFIFAVPDFFAAMLATRFRGERPVYGLRGVSLRQEGNFGRWPTMADLGAELVDEICRRFPNERCIVAGYSFGATMAVETVRLMEERGLPVRGLYLIAPMALDVYRVGPLRFRIGGLRKPVGDLTPGEALRLYARDNNPLTRLPYRHLWLFFGIFPWRRLRCLVGRVRRALGLPLTPGILWADVRVERFRLHGQYRPRAMRTPTVIFNAREPATDAGETWRPWFSGPLTIHQIPDPHLGGDSIEQAEAAILEHLTDLDADAGPGTGRTER